MNAETPLMRSIRIAVNRVPGVRVVRNNTGQGKLEHGGYVTFGLGNGGADLVGLLAPSGRAIALEVKRPGRKAQDDQRRWASAFRRFGGVCEVVNSPAQALAVLELVAKGEL